jgi:sugar lactone lactonase YvrE
MPVERRERPFRNAFMPSIRVRGIVARPLPGIVASVGLLFLSACGGGDHQRPPARYLTGGSIQGIPLSLDNATVPVAGNPATRAYDGTGPSAGFGFPMGIVSDGTNLYIADQGGHTIRKVAIATGAVTTLAGAAMQYGYADGTGSGARFFSPCGIARVGTSLYVADQRNHAIRKVAIATGAVTTLAGSPDNADWVDGAGAGARFNLPSDLATDGTSLFVVDEGNGRIRKVAVATGETATLYGPTGDPLAGLATDGTNLYVGEGTTVRKVVIATGETAVVAGLSGASGSADGAAADARFGGPVPMTVSGTGLYVADSPNNTIRKIDLASGAVSTIAGTAVSYGTIWPPPSVAAVDGTGAAARFHSPHGGAVAGSDLYVTDSRNRTLRRFALAAGTVTTPAGTPGDRCVVDGSGTGALFFGPQGIATDGRNLFAVDSGVIRKIAIDTGAVSTLALRDASGSPVTLPIRTGITTDGANLYVSGWHAIWKVGIDTGTVSNLAGGGSSYLGSGDGIGEAARFGSISGITTDGKDLYAVDGSTVRQVDLATRMVTTYAGVRLSFGSEDGLCAYARFRGGGGIATDGRRLYLAESSNATIRTIDFATRMVGTLAGTALESGAADGTGAAARFRGPMGITTDGTYLYVADKGNHAIRRVEIATGKVTTPVGTAGPGAALYADGTGAAARLVDPYGVTTDGNRLFFTDSFDGVVRSVR